jgi:Protein of unknown function (DUF3592)
MSTRPSIFRIIKSDYVATLCLIFPLAAWVMYISVAVFGFFPATRMHPAIEGSQDAPFFLIIALLSTAIFVPLLVWRVYSISSKFAGGVEVPGRITNIQFSRDRGTVEYTYEYQGRRYAAANNLRRNSGSRRLIGRKDITVVVDRDNPTRAFIKELYVLPGG